MTTRETLTTQEAVQRVSRDMHQLAGTMRRALTDTARRMTECFDRFRDAAEPFATTTPEDRDV